MDIPPIKELRGLCQATAPNPARESFTGRFSRVFSIYFTRLLIPTSLTPNQITSLSVVVFFVGTAFFFSTSYWMHLTGCAIIFFSIVLDGCDGEIARYKKNGGVAGTMYVEPVSHDIQYGIMFLLLGVALIFQGYPWWYLLLGAVASITKLLYRLLEIRFWSLTSASITTEQLEQRKQAHATLPPSVRLFYWVNKNFFSSTGVFLVLFILCLINKADWYLWYFGIGYTALWILLATKQFKKIATKNI